MFSFSPFLAVCDISPVLVFNMVMSEFFLLVNFHHSDYCSKL